MIRPLTPPQQFSILTPEVIGLTVSNESKGAEPPSGPNIPMIADHGKNLALSAFVVVAYGPPLQYEYAQASVKNSRSRECAIDLIYASSRAIVSALCDEGRILCASTFPAFL